ncbi:MAG: hypothetical protein CMC79_05555 [Flavobacteriaceae bacterium]|nr:hypothetical protein [Flavobacteriaceae bacterium]|tara:strand:- start:4625 stop:7177 length:2553 start_codon:yes stop_codon:yes gene_type:complete
MKNFIGILALIISFSISAQPSKKKPSPDQKKSKKTLAELTKSSKKIDGLFAIYQDTITGEIKISIKNNQLNKDFIYFAQIADGVTEAGSFRGLYKGSTVFQIRKYFDKIEIFAPNTNFYFDKDNPISKSKNANMSDAILSSSKILNLNEKSDTYLINANDLFLSEILTRIKPPKRPKSSPFSFSLGMFDKSKSKVKEINNYPENTNIKTEYVYKNPSVLNQGSDAIADGRNVSIKVFHSLTSMPKDDYEIRFDDPRVGYFMTKVNDLTSTETTNYRDMINRWKLIKKNPNLEISEPIKPITWWIENTTPLEWRETIKEGVLEWNIAFEKAGFKNAIQVKVQPDDASWDAGDIRYNVLRWTSSPRPPFGGYGPSMKNPRTGEIFGADIMLEYVHFTNRVFYDKIYVDPTSIMKLETKQEIIENKLVNNPLFCSMGYIMHENLLFGSTILKTRNSSDIELDNLIKQGMKALIMHEVGHTLGLNHNMKSSHLFSPEQLEDAEFIEGKSLTGSVMDYTAINLTLDQSKQGQYYGTSMGPYDIWAIQYGYTPFENNEQMETLLEKSSNPDLIFGNDADDMRSPGKAIDPRVMTGDLSNDPISYSISRFKIVNDFMLKIKDKMVDDGQTYEDLRRSYYVLFAQAARAGDIISRYIGGVYVDRSTYGQKGGNKPYTPVSLNDQKRALNALKNYVFSPKAFNTPSYLYNYLARQRRGFDFRSEPEDPKIHNQILGYQSRVLAHLLHPNTLQRITDSELYGNQYKLSDLMSDLNNAIIEEDIKANVNTFRQNLQLTYVKRLIEIASNKSSRYNLHSQSMAIYNLKSIHKSVNKPKGNIISIAHKNHLKVLIDNALNEIN